MEYQIQEFSDMDDLFATIHKGVQRAKEMSLPRQEQITYDDYWMRIWGDILIFGHIHTVEELDAEERRLGATEEEIAWEHQIMQGSYDNGFRFGTAWSVLEPRGELGDTHVSTMIPITKEEFEEAQSLNWNGDLISDLPWFFDAVERLRNPNA